MRTQALHEALETKALDMWREWRKEISSRSHQQLRTPCPKCRQTTVVCCWIDVGQGGPDHHDQFCHVCLNPACNFGEHQAHTIASSMVTADDQQCWFCGRDVLAEG